MALVYQSDSATEVYDFRVEVDAPTPQRRPVLDPRRAPLMLSDTGAIYAIRVLFEYGVKKD